MLKTLTFMILDQKYFKARYITKQNSTFGTKYDI